MWCDKCESCEVMVASVKDILQGIRNAQQAIRPAGSVAELGHFQSKCCDGEDKGNKKAGTGRGSFRGSFRDRTTEAKER